MIEENVAVYFSRFAFVFLIYVVITSGYINETLSCQMRHFLKTTKYGRHILGLALIFVFIMMEGGWSFNKKDDEKADNDWSSGNVIHTMALAVAIYAIFLLSSKSRLLPNMVFFGITFILYLINTQRSYWFARKQISENTNRSILQMEVFLLIAAIIVLTFGFIDYIFFQKQAYGFKFSWPLFLLGTPHCASLRNLRD